MKYIINRTDKFNDQLTDIIMYIASNYSNTIALDYLTYLENEVNNLADYPYIGSVPRYQAIAKQGFRALVCKQNIIFYKVNEERKEVVLHIIVSTKRNYINLI